MSEYTNLTDNELLRVVGMKSTLTPLEIELMARLERALDEMDGKHGDDPRRSGEGGGEEGTPTTGYLALLSC